MSELTFKGTPGPWTVELGDEDNFAIVKIGNKVISGRDLTDASHDATIENANAALIAAAPELLEALQTIVAYHTPSE